MDGVIVIDKPRGVTSHDVVAAVRRGLGESRIGHTGTLDPLATGVLPLVIGKATRLARFLTASDKEYEATIRFGVTTDSYDVDGAETRRSDRRPAWPDVERALMALTGQYLQTPPAYSAKKVAGRRAYDLARQQVAVTLTPVMVTASRVTLTAFSPDRATVVLTCSAGFYVRAFAHALGEHLGTGACLEALRRTRSGEFTLDRAVSLDSVSPAGRPDRSMAPEAPGVIPMDELLLELPAVQVSDEGRTRVSHGRELEASHLASDAPRSAVERWVRLVDGAGHLVALATAIPAQSALHPSVVLI